MTTQSWKPLPTVTITLHPEKGVQVELKNWTGVNASMQQKMMDEFVRAQQRHKAAAIQAARVDGTYASERSDNPQGVTNVPT